MKLKDIARYVTDKVSSDAIGLENYVTTDSILQNKAGRVEASNLPPTSCTLTRFQKGDILIANIRPYLRKIWLADIDGGCNADVLVFRAINGYSSAFVYAVLMQDSFYIYAMKGAKGSKMPRGDKEQIMRFEVPSNLQDTDEIGYFIVAIKAKIDLLNQINRNLEAMARQLYDYWFVQFDFPDASGRPYKSSGGKMVWNEKLKREIPEGWEAAQMKDFLVIVNGKDHKELANGIYPVYGTGGLMRCANDYLFSGESVLLPRKGSLSNFMYVNEAFWTVDTMFHTKEKMKGAAKYIFYSLRYVDITRYDSGTGVPSMTSISYYAMPFVQPPQNILGLFNQKVSPWLKQIKRNEKGISQLNAQRDELLPLLMNGQVSVRPTAVNYDF